MADESRRAVETIHIALIAGATALLSFVLSGSDAEIYTQARIESNALRDMHVESDFYAYLASSLDEQIERQGEEIVKAVAPDLEGRGIRRSFSFMPIIVAQLPSRSTTIETLDGMLEEERTPFLVVPVSNNAVKQALRTAAETYAKSPCRANGLTRTVPCGAIPTNYVLSDIAIMPTISGPNDFFHRGYRFVSDDTWSNQIVKIEFTFIRANSSEYETGIRISAPVIVTMLDRGSERYLRDHILKNHSRAAVVLFEGSNKTKALPKLHAIWDEIFAMSPSVASHYLAVKETTARQSLSAFGISVKEERLVVLGPGLMFFVSLYFLAVLRNLVIVRNPNLNADEGVLWIGESVDPLSIVTTTLSACVLPSSAAILSVTNWSHGMDWRILVAGMMTIGTIFVSVVTFTTLRKLRSLRLRHAKS